MKRKIGIWAVLGVAVALLVYFIVFNDSSNPSAQRASGEFVAHIQDVDAASAYDQFSSAGRAATSSSEFETLVTRIGPILSGKPKLVQKVLTEQPGKDDSAQVVYEITGTDGIAYLVTVNLVIVKGDWKVLSLTSSTK